MHLEGEDATIDTTNEDPFVVRVIRCAECDDPSEYDEPIDISDLYHVHALHAHTIVADALDATHARQTGLPAIADLYPAIAVRSTTATLEDGSSRPPSPDAARHAFACMGHEAHGPTDPHGLGPQGAQRPFVLTNAVHALTQAPANIRGEAAIVRFLLDTGADTGLYVERDLRPLASSERPGALIDGVAAARRMPHSNTFWVVPVGGANPVEMLLHFCPPELQGVSVNVVSHGRLRKQMLCDIRYEPELRIDMRCGASAPIHEHAYTYYVDMIVRFFPKMAK